MPASKATARAQIAAPLLDPTNNQAVAGGQNKTILLTFDTGRNPNLPGLLDAIETFYGAGKVTAENDTTAHGIMRLRVAA